jgi:outer membrane immunogenic protein
MPRALLVWFIPKVAQMKRFAFFFASVALTVEFASAADLPSRKEPVLPPVPVLSSSSMWTGFYVGLNAGGAWSAGGQQYGTTIARTNLLDESLVQTGGPFWGISNNYHAGVTGGGQFGYAYQISSAFVTGLEVDFQGSSMNGHSGTISTYPETAYSASPDGIWSASTATAYSASAIDWWGTARARIGVTPFSSMPGLLAYGTGGFAYGGTRATNTMTTVVEPLLGAGFARYSYGGTRVGWTAGGGVEWQFIQNWSVKAEYLYTDLGAARGYAMGRGVTHPLFVNGFKNTNAYRFNTVRLGVNYRFNWDHDPIVARY